MLLKEYLINLADECQRLAEKLDDSGRSMNSHELQIARIALVQYARDTLLSTLGEWTITGSHDNIEAMGDILNDMSDLSK